MQDNFEIEEENPAHDRGIPSVNERSTTKKRKLVLILLISLIVIALLIGALVVKTSKSKAKNEPKPTQQTERKSSRKTFDFTPEVPPIDVAEKVEEAGKKVPAVEPIDDPQQKLEKELDQEESEETAQPTVPPPDPRLTSPIINVGDPDKESTLPPEASLTNLPTSSNMASALTGEGEEQETDGPLAQQLTATVTTAKSASFLPNRDYLLAKGAIFPCNMDTSLDTTVAGMVRCKVAKNVYSANGRVLLIEKGSEAVGEYQSNAKQGQSRIYVLWNSIRTPNGVDVPLDSLSADQLGGMGIPGHVDSHFWERFGGAMMVSITGDALQLLKQTGSGSGTNVYTNSADQAGKMSEEVLRNTINIPPTIYTNHGEKVQIYVARNINFESVYHVR